MIWTSIEIHFGHYQLQFLLQQDDDTFRRNSSGTSLVFENIQTVRATGHYQCQAGNLYGKTEASTTSEVTVEGKS